MANKNGYISISELIDFFKKSRKTIESATDYILGNDEYNLTLTGTKVIKGTGNTLDNIIYGNSANNILDGKEGNDTLDGGAGADTMIGGLGDDTFVVDNENDKVIEYANEGIDVVQSNINYILGNNLECLRLTGSAIKGTGNALNNLIYGNSENNTLDGGTGVDTMIGGLGDDIFIVDNAQDKVVEYFNEGIDTVQSSIDYTLVQLIEGETVYSLRDYVENLTLTGLAIKGTGNSLDNTIIGNSANNTLNGKAGNDYLDGGEGNDTASYNNAERTKGIEVNLSQGKSYDLSDVSLIKTDDKKVVFNSTSGLSNLDLNKYNFKLFGSWLNDQNLKAEVKLVDKSVANQISFWVVGVDWSYTKARKIVLKETVNGIEVNALEAKYIDKIDLNFNFNIGGNSLVDSFNYSVKIESGNSTLKDTLVNIENIEGSIYNDILVGNSANNILDGKAGNDTYLFEQGSGKDTITDSSGTDNIVFDSTVSKSNVAFYLQNDNNLAIKYSTNDSITVSTWNNVANKIEKVQLSDGNYLSSTDVDKLIQSMSTYATSKSIALSNANDVSKNAELMTMIANSWHK